MKYKKNWNEAREKWTNYWKHQNQGRPLMCVIARAPETEEAWQAASREGKPGYLQLCQGIDYFLPDSMAYHNTYEQYRSAANLVGRYRHFCENHRFLAESFPNLSVDFGPGVMAAYQGCEIQFQNDTVWFEPFVEDWDELPEIRFQEQAQWWQEHYQLVKDVKALAGDDFYIGMPDIIANLDIIASLRGSENAIYDLYDCPDQVKSRLHQLAEAYYDYYDRFYELIRNEEDQGSCYTVFQVWGPGKMLMLQCDFAAMISPEAFREFALEPLRAQAKKADSVMFHLDGAECMRHIDALMEIEELDALQYTSGDYGPDGTTEDTNYIYDKAREAGKSLWVKVYSGDVNDWIRNTERLVERYGSHSLFLHYPEMSMADAEKLLIYAEDHWKDVPGIL